MKIGDRITFTVTTRGGRRKATRTINGFYGTGPGRRPTVRYSGWSDFVVGVFPGDVIHSVETPADE
jgi:hypothetical protein